MQTVQNRDAEIEKAVLSYVAAWNEDDPDRLRELLHACWADRGMVVSNYELIVGRDALFDHIVRFRQQAPGARGLLTSGIEQHHDFFRFTVVVMAANGQPFSPALEVGQLDIDGRIERIITFFHALPRPPAHWPSQLTG